MEVNAHRGVRGEVGLLPQATVVDRAKDAEYHIGGGGTVLICYAGISFVNASAISAEFGQWPVEPVWQVLIAVVAVVLDRLRRQLLCRDVQVQRLQQRHAASACLPALLGRVDTCSHGDHCLGGRRSSPTARRGFHGFLISQRLMRRLIEALRSVHVEAKEVL